MNQPDLWDYAHARATDPETSKLSAANARRFARGHSAKILAALAAGPAGQSLLANRTGLLPHQVNKRLADLSDAGVIVLTGRTVTGHSGNQEREWRTA